MRFVRQPLWHNTIVRTAWLENAQERHKVRLFLRGQDQAEAVFIEMHDIQQRLRRPVVKIGGARSQATRLYGEGPAFWMALTYIYGRAGQLERARREMEKLENLSRQEPLNPVVLLWARLGVGNKEEALADLERAYSQRYNGMTSLTVEPGFDPLRSDPRFQDLLRRVGF